jgi:hypothetical protein
MDMGRMHFPGYLSNNVYIAVVQVSTVHVYLTCFVFWARYFIHHAVISYPEFPIAFQCLA